MTTIIEMKIVGSRLYRTSRHRQPIADAPGGSRLMNPSEQNRTATFLVHGVQLERISSRSKCKSPPVLADRDQQKS